MIEMCAANSADSRRAAMRRSSLSPWAPPTSTRRYDLGGKRLDLTKSLNFILSPDFFQQGLTHFRVERLNVEGPGGATLTCAAA